jgi:hypothetical protein
MAEAQDRCALLQEQGDKCAAELAASHHEIERLRTLNANQAEDRKNIEAAHQRAVDAWRVMHPKSAGGLPPERATVVAWLLAQLEDLHEQLRIADADRVPLRMDLDATREELRLLRAHTDRMEVLIKAVRRWNMAIDGTSITEALDEYEKACSAAANAEQDDQSGADPSILDAFPLADPGPDPSKLF